MEAICARRNLFVDLIPLARAKLDLLHGIAIGERGCRAGGARNGRRNSELCDRPLRKARLFTHLTDLPQAQSPIVPVLLGDPVRALAAQALLERHGFLVVAIRPPTVPANTARLRFTFTAAHPDEEIERLAGIVCDRILEQPA